MDQVIDLTLKHPSKILIYGPSNSGKSTFVEKLLLYMKELFDIYFDKIFYISESYFPKFQYIHGRFINKLKDINKEFLDKLDNNQNKLIIIDDKMHSATNDILISDLFLDFDQNTPENVRVRTNIFPNEEQSAYVKLSQI